MVIVQHLVWHQPKTNWWDCWQGDWIDRWQEQKLVLLVMKRRKAWRVFLHGDWLSTLCVGRYFVFCDFFCSVPYNTSGKILSVSCIRKGRKRWMGRGGGENVRKSRGYTKVGGGEGRGQGRRCSRSWSRCPSCCWGPTLEQVYPEGLQAMQDPALQQGKSMRRRSSREELSGTDPSSHSPPAPAAWGRRRERTWEWSWAWEKGKKKGVILMFDFIITWIHFIWQQIKIFFPQWSLVCLWW